MFSSISWSQYFLAVALILIVYYLYIGFKYYGDELNALLRGKTGSPVVTPSTTPNRTAPAQPVVPDNSLLGQTNPNRANLTESLSYKSPVIPGRTTAYPEPESANATTLTAQEIEELEETETLFETIDQIDLEFEDSEPSTDNTILVSDLTDLVDNVDNVIHQASENQVDKVVLSENLRSLLEPHHALSSGIKEKISEHITATADQTGAAIINKNEVAALWNNNAFFE
jgi:hypothetical protein